MSEFPVVASNDKGVCALPGGNRNGENEQTAEALVQNTLAMHIAFLALSSLSILNVLCKSYEKIHAMFQLVFCKLAFSAFEFI